MIKPPRSDGWVSATDAMMALGCSKWALARLRKRKAIRFRKVNARRFLYRAGSIRALSMDF